MASEAYAPAGDQMRRIGWFALWNLVSFAAMFGIFLAVRDAPGWDGAFRLAFEFFYRHETLAVAAAFMPFCASLLVGWGYAQRARRRRARAAAAASSVTYSAT
jgi:hypothetical protein